MFVRVQECEFLRQSIQCGGVFVHTQPQQKPFWQSSTSSAYQGNQAAFGSKFNLHCSKSFSCVLHSVSAKKNYMAEKYRFQPFRHYIRTFKISSSSGDMTYLRHEVKSAITRLKIGFQGSRTQGHIQKGQIFLIWKFHEHIWSVTFKERRFSGGMFLWIFNAHWKRRRVKRPSLQLSIWHWRSSTVKYSFKMLILREKEWKLRQSTLTDTRN